MLLIRRFEEKVKQLYQNGEIFGAIHLYIGQEAIATGVCSVLRTDDFVFSTHRGHGHYLAKTNDIFGAIAELMGRSTGCSKGCGGSMHMFNIPMGFMGGNGIVGGGIPLAAGAAFAAQYIKSDAVSTAFFGDGAANQGTFHETLNLAAVKKLPFIAVCENNCYAATTPVKSATSREDMVSRAEAYGIPGIRVDGNDVHAVRAGAEKAVMHARQGNGPFLIDCKTYRVEPHCGIIADARPPEERSYWQDPANDPIKRIISADHTYFSEKKILEIEASIKDAIEAAVSAARSAPFPSVNEFDKEFFNNEKNNVY